MAEPSDSTRLAGKAEPKRGGEDKNLPAVPDADSPPDCDGPELEAFLSDPEVADLIKDPERRGKVFAMFRSMEFFQGPLPPARELERYESVLPGAADRIIGMTEKEGEHRRDLESQVTKSNIVNARRGQWMGFVLALCIVAGGIALILADCSTSGVAVIIATLVSLVGVFVYGRHKGEKSLKEGD